ncbi:TPA: hypothetical protein I7763_13065, partial [Vibrio vulnificus]|nr:hypothetical protein [Vibrio vulnificus]
VNTNTVEVDKKESTKEIIESMGNIVVRSLATLQVSGSANVTVDHTTNPTTKTFYDQNTGKVSLIENSDATTTKVSITISIGPGSSSGTERRLDDSFNNYGDFNLNIDFTDGSNLFNENGASNVWSQNPWTILDSNNDARYITSDMISYFSTTSRSFSFGRFTTNFPIYLSDSNLYSEIKDFSNPFKITLFELAMWTDLTVGDLMADPFVGTRFSFMPLAVIYSPEFIRGLMDSKQEKEESDYIYKMFTTSNLAWQANYRDYKSVSLYEYLNNPDVNPLFKNMTLGELIEPKILQVIYRETGLDKEVF